MMRPRFFIPVLAAAGPFAAQASELSYTYVDFQAYSTDTAQTGQQVPVPGQTVRVQTENGDGIAIGGAVALGQRFYFTGQFRTSIIDVRFSAGVSSCCASA